MKRVDHRKQGYVQAQTWCETCGKRCYSSRSEAKKAARQMQQRQHNNSHLNAYRCGDAWHLGHLPTKVVRGDIGRDVLNDTTRTRRGAR